MPPPGWRCDFSQQMRKPSCFHKQCSYYLFKAKETQRSVNLNVPDSTLEDPSVTNVHLYLWTGNQLKNQWRKNIWETTSQVMQAQLQHCRTGSSSDMGFLGKLKQFWMTSLWAQNGSKLDWHCESRGFWTGHCTTVRSGVTSLKVIWKSWGSWTVKFYAVLLEAMQNIPGKCCI